MSFVEHLAIISSGFDIHCKLLRGLFMVADYPVHFAARLAQAAELVVRNQNKKNEENEFRNYDKNK